MMRDSFNSPETARSWIVDRRVLNVKMVMLKCLRYFTIKFAMVAKRWVVIK